MIGGVAVAAISTSSALAQSAPQTLPPQSTPAKDSTKVGELVVTGSRIPQVNLTSVSPVTTVGAKDIKLTGYNNISDVLNQLPQITASQGGSLGNAATGTATVSLRDLGPSRTLVLIDGRRMIPGDPTFPYPDINNIPTPLIQRVEVDTAGASAVYGSDAIAGVVNFIMKKNYEGLELNVNYSFSQNNNGNDAAQQANKLHNFPYPTGSVAGGDTWQASAIFGINSPDGKGNIEGYLNYLHSNPVFQGSRDYGHCALSAHALPSATPWTCGGSGYSATSNIYNYGNSGFETSYNHTTVKGTPTSGVLAPFTAADQYNYAPYNMYQRPDERYSGGFFGNYQINSHINAYASAMFMDDRTVSQIAPAPWFETVAIPCNNPLLSAQEVATLCTAAGLGKNDVNSEVQILRRSVETGPRTYTLHHDDFQFVTGFKGDLAPNWTYDVYGQYSQANYTQEYTNSLSLSKIANALDVVPDANGNPVCAVGGACVPYNIWAPGGVTAAALNYLKSSATETGQTSEQVVSGQITGNLGGYGITSPFAKDGIGIALGSDFRRDALYTNPDPAFQSGDLAGQGGATVAENGAISVEELFMEARVPLVQDQPFAKNIDLDVGYRWSDYSQSGTSSAYQILGNWAINDYFLLRGGFNRSVRAPNVIELFSPQNVQLDGSTDGCAGIPGSVTLIYSAAQCAYTGVSASQYGHIAASTAAQYNGKVGGNPDLTPEQSNNWSVGGVFTSANLIPGSMSLSIDYFNLTVNNVIQAYGADNVLNLCATTGDALYCNLVHRAPGTGSLFRGTGANQPFIVDTLQNQGYLKTAGIDFAFDYRIPFTGMGLPDYGTLELSFLGTYTSEYQLNSAGNILNCVGVYGPVCNGTSTPMSGPLPDFKANTRLTWTTPVKGLQASLNWRYIGPLDLETGQTNLPDSHIGAYNYFDLAGTWRVKDRYTFSMGVNNLFDKDPPLIGASELPVPPYGNGNTFSQSYDVLGRYFFFGVTADF